MPSYSRDAADRLAANVMRSQAGVQHQQSGVGGKQLQRQCGVTMSCPEEEMAGSPTSSSAGMTSAAARARLRGIAKGIVALGDDMPKVSEILSDKLIRI
ncbi:MAG: hypothetical protein F6K47_35625 [Symploca sp. SIO2E6]|nr:hypothetical protein [Symploca sp. SIO2E6]